MEFNFDVALDQGQTPPPASPEVVSEDAGINLIPEHGPFDLEPVKARLAAFEPQIEMMVLAAREFQVDGPEALEQATTMALQVKKLEKDITAAKDKITRPYFEFKRDADALTKSYVTRLGQIMSALEPKIIACRRKLDAERQEQERRMQAEAAANAAKAKAEAEALGVEAAPAVVPVGHKAETVTRTDAGAAHTRTVWKFKVQDETRVPREYLVLSDKLVNEAIRQGVRNIPGLEIFQEESLTIKTK